MSINILDDSTPNINPESHKFPHFFAESPLVHLLDRVQHDPTIRDRWGRVGDSFLLEVEQVCEAALSAAFEDGYLADFQRSGKLFSWSESHPLHRLIEQAIQYQRSGVTPESTDGLPSLMARVVHLMMLCDWDGGCWFRTVAKDAEQDGYRAARRRVNRGRLEARKAGDSGASGKDKIVSRSRKLSGYRL